jgi:hypothetical protein
VTQVERLELAMRLKVERDFMKKPSAARCRSKNCRWRA